MSNFCLRCAKKRKDCCRSDYIKFSTLKDAERIAKFLDTRVNNVIIYSQLSKKDKKTQLYLKKIHNYYYDLVSEDGKILQLKKRKDGCCFFLSKTGHCRIYEVRPLICRVFPFWYSNNGEIIIDYNGLDCDIVKSKNVLNQKIKPEYRLDVFKNFSCTELGLKKLLTQLKEEVECYKKNIYNFITLNDVKKL